MRLHARSSRGFTLIAVMLAVVVMVGLVAAWGRHVVIAGRGGLASHALLASREACHSGLTFARQAALSGAEEIPAAIPCGEAVAHLTVTATGDGDQLLSVESLGQDDLGARRTLVLGRQGVAASAPDGPAALPTLGAATVAQLLADPWLAVHHVQVPTVLQGAELSGLYVVHPGARLELADVVLHGAVVSAAVLTQAQPGAFDPSMAPRLRVAGNLRIDPSIALPGVAILMPDGRVESAPVDARIQIHGDVVAHDVSLLHAGALAGHVAGVQVALAEPGLLDRLGFDRRPPPWSPMLDLGPASEPTFLALAPPDGSLGALSGIIDYWKQDGTP